MKRLVRARSVILVDELTTRYRRLDEYIMQRRKETPLTSADSRLSRTVRWLLDVQRGSGAWGNDEIASTALTILALVSLDRQGLLNDPQGEVDAAITRAVGFLRDSYGQGQWERAVWDTAVATRAIRQADLRSPLLDPLKDWLLRPATSRTHGPHHHAQRLLTLYDFGTHRDTLNDIADVMCARAHQNLERYSPYVVGQLLEALLCVRPDDPLVTECMERLAKYLGEVSLDSANFINVCAALQGLHGLHDASHVRSTRVAVASLFGDTSFRDNGSWYRNELQTAWGILTLTRYSTEIQIEGSYHELRSQVSDFSAEVVNLVVRYNKVQRATAWLIALGSALFGGLLCLFIVLSNSKSHTNGWEDWALGSAMTVGISTILAGLKVFGIRFDDERAR
jgi:hypothetical protein